ncbi:hypothetical protein KM792_08075 [Clostridium tyrobutyricum]|uniref:hypothetical protein n=1 Tax=Clostridium tyrobutyricum TaxID=1519 RepID=UPI00073D34A7|nr:hypothetical protein [Clostridium tyrobutyricum]MBV4439150.1 hypothetical protein [Clostridium tyrobutyricum]MBV4445362.1 hypothetical protein [Clostridium tyrobutyricum]MBV4445433.1 hypothetical protein [Clostridium tyrobutyricum]MBV4449609.1 hypothetical protein [Clostridium tyrobutyricum]
MKLENKNLNFSLKLVCFSALVIASYFFIENLSYIAIIPVIMCIYDGFKIFKCMKNRDGLKIVSFLATILVLIFILHLVVVSGIGNPVPVLLLFLITNLFFIYNIIIYIYNRYRKLTLLLHIILWILCDSIPILMVFILSAGLTS